MNKQKCFKGKRIIIASAITTVALCCSLALSFISEARADRVGINNVVASTPKIFIDTKEYSLDSIPSANIGNAYRIFDVEANDSFGNSIEVETRVYLNYSSETRSRIYVENGEFIPNYYGIYTVEYTAIDRSGNIVVSTYDVTCEEKESLKATVINEVLSGVAGEEIKLSGLEYENAIGTTSYQITVTHKDGKAVYELGDKTAFVPMFAGEYTIEYEYFDYNETGKVEYTCMVAVNDSPVIFDKIALPKYFLMGCSYELPIPQAYSFKFGKPIKLNPMISTQYKDVAPVPLDGTKFTPTTEGECTIIYTATFDGGSTKDCYKIPVVDVGYTDELKMEKYFYGESVVVRAASNAIELHTVTDGASTEFINALLVERLTMDFGFDLEKNAFEKLDIWLTDSVDTTEKVKISIFKDTNQYSQVAINDKVVGKTDASFYKTDITNLSYDNSAYTVSLGGLEGAKIKTNYNGEPFEGFKSKFAYVRLVFSGVTGESKVNFSMINNQALFNEGDSNAPYVVYSRYSKGKKTIGDVIELDPVYVGDVLTPSYKVRYYVKSPDGNYAVDENGTLLSPENADATSSYCFIAQQFGRYLVTIGVSDAFGNEYMYSYAINILDMELPVIKFSNNKNETAKLGSILNIKSAIVTDNVSENIVINVYVIAPNGRVSEYNTGYKLTEKGVYKVFYYAFDEEGNTAIKSYIVTVQ